MGGKLPLVDGANGRDGLAAVSPMLKRRSEPARLGSAELHGYVVTTSTNHELQAIWAGRADLQPFQRRLKFLSAEHFAGLTRASRMSAMGRKLTLVR